MDFNLTVKFSCVWMNESVSLNLSVKVLNANKLREHEFVKYNLFPYSIYFRYNYLGKNSYTDIWYHEFDIYIALYNF